MPIAEIDTAAVLRAVEPIWTTKTETASRVRGRIESILGWATTKGFRSAGDNPARWAKHLENLLPAKTKVAPVVHHAALPYAELAEFMAVLRTKRGVAARALDFMILTASRVGEVVGARWSEFALAERLWTVPAARIKGGVEHRVPLSDAAMAILEATPRQGDLVFPVTTSGVQKVVLEQMKRRDITVHGFRSTFKDWAAERTNFPAEVADMALAHVVGDKVEAAYRRGDLFDKRRQLADAWARYIVGEVEHNVVQLRG
jgi:integrase